MSLCETDEVMADMVALVRGVRVASAEPLRVLGCTAVAHLVPDDRGDLRRAGLAEECGAARAAAEVVDHALAQDDHRDVLVTPDHEVAARPLWCSRRTPFLRP